MLFVKVSTLLLLIASVSDAFIYGFEKPDNFVGEKCITKNNEPGYCQEYLKCKSAQQLYRSKRAVDITMCKFLGKAPIVCCPSIPKAPIKKTSLKFQNALCKNVQPGLKIDDHIIGGQKAVVSEFPFQAALGYTSENGLNFDFNCGGSLIADDVILTAAHCVNRRDTQPVIVRLGRVSKMINISQFLKLIYTFFVPLDIS
jgi:hypothetical protein